MKSLYILLLVAILSPLTAVSQTEKQQEITAAETETPAASPTETALTVAKDSLSVPLSSPIPQPGFVAPFRYVRHYPVRLWLCYVAAP